MGCRRVFPAEGAEPEGEAHVQPGCGLGRPGAPAEDVESPKAHSSSVASGWIQPQCMVFMPLGLADGPFGKKIVLRKNF